MRDILSRNLFVLLVVLLSNPFLFILNVEGQTRIITVPREYATIQEAIENANPGDIIFVKKGTYQEDKLEITKTLSLIGEDTNSSKINLNPTYNETRILTQSFRTYSNAININADNVKIECLSISTPGGNFSATGDRIQISNCNIATGLLIKGTHCNITKNTLSRLQLIGHHSNLTSNIINGGYLRITGSFNLIISNNALVDITLLNADSNIICNNTCARFLIGYRNNCSYNEVSGNRIEPTSDYMGYYGMRVGSSYNTFFKNQISNFNRSARFAIWLDGLKAFSNIFYHNNFINNTKGVFIENENLTKLVNYWDYNLEGNYWVDYNGSDINRDGLGDTPYIINDNNKDNYPLIAPYDIEKDMIVVPQLGQFTAIIIITLVIIIVGFGVLGYLVKKRINK